jgi:molybdenum cofactor cytidylyltransferase
MTPQHLSSECPVVIVLAAGRGERFRAAGGQTGKLQALLAGKPVLDHVLDAVKRSGLPCHVVRPEHLAHQPKAGMGDSIAAGVAATAGAPGWLILPGDLPLIRADTLRRVAQALMAGSTGPEAAVKTVTVQPQFQGQRGHPVGFDASCEAALLALQGDEGAKSVLRHCPPWMLEVDDEGAVWDVDTPERLAQAASRLR